ncbi:hypothetical protein G5V59_19255 [Nocardioides sp. W3-2-3]|uniref:thermonuclease family protein n=1 Tax=Nocardioides convexus TaxID=2712224 RepID=UPI0024184829|nr:thermonuclease family protein [Nocardioides convexus]NHA01267.1 hypothetical protein [Nocardioides convexus]
MLGLDAPEVAHPPSPAECYATDATRLLERLAPVGSTVDLVTDTAQPSRDRYDRLLRYVDHDDDGHRVDVGREFLASGAARRYEADEALAREESYAAAFDDAQGAERGLWGSLLRAQVQVIDEQADAGREDAGPVVLRPRRRRTPPRLRRATAQTRRRPGPRPTGTGAPRAGAMGTDRHPAAAAPRLGPRPPGEPDGARCVPALRRGSRPVPHPRRPPLSRVRWPPHRIVVDEGFDTHPCCDRPGANGSLAFLEHTAQAAGSHTARPVAVIGTRPAETDPPRVIAPTPGPHLGDQGGLAQPVPVHGIHGSSHE